MIEFGETADVGRRIGMFTTIFAAGALVGPPISGAIYVATGGFEAVGYYAGMMTCCSSDIFDAGADGIISFTLHRKHGPSGGCPAVRRPSVGVGPAVGENLADVRHETSCHVWYRPSNDSASPTFDLLDTRPSLHSGGDN
jgi:hypothetical protein